MRLLQSQDYERIQISDVLVEAKVARATLYRYFASKDHLYAVVVREWSGVEHGEVVFPAGCTSEERVRCWIHRFIRAVERQPQFFKALTALQNSSDAEAIAVMAETANTSRNTLVGYFEVLGPVDANDAASMLLAIVNTLTVRAVYSDGNVAEVHRLADRFIDSVSADLR